MKNLVLNPEYLLINDINRIIICDSDNLSFIHPLYATILTYFDRNDNIEVDKKIEIISNELSIEKKQIEKFVKLLTNNNERVWIGEGESLSQFPENVIIARPTGYKPRNYSLKDFLIGNKKYDNKKFRLNKPIDFTFVINTKCYTNCVYCYADLKYNYMKNQLSTNRIIEIVQEARSLNMRSVEITGGEFFLHKDWDIILIEFLKNGFDPKLSTKIPLNEETIKKISEIGLKTVQLSLDCLDENILNKTIRVNKGYVEK
jgi:sulfatase maturation enzyme AslB (radical SAM superfamily)